MKKAYLLFALYLFSNSALAEKINVAVASNFTAAAKEIAHAFESEHGSKVVLSFGSTGKLYAQIQYGAPFHIFLAADELRPQKLIQTGNGINGTRFTYAEGRVVLYSPIQQIGSFDPTQLPKMLVRQDIAVANPKTAPYGSASLIALEKLGVTQNHDARFVYGENIAQTFQFAETGNVSFAFVSLSQVLNKDSSSFWLLPRDLHTPIKQDAVLLLKGRENTTALKFMQFLKAPDTKSIIRKHGYYL